LLWPGGGILILVTNPVFITFVGWPRQSAFVLEYEAGRLTDGNQKAPPTNQGLKVHKTLCKRMTVTESTLVRGGSTRMSNDNLLVIAGREVTAMVVNSEGETAFRRSHQTLIGHFQLGNGQAQSTCACSATMRNCRADSKTAD